jgi:hypothetical protein
MRKTSRMKIQIPSDLGREQLRIHAQTAAHRIASYGWRPRSSDLQTLQTSLQNPQAYRTLARAWRKAGFRTLAIRKLAGRIPASTK